jgi:hypothetical protein
MRGKRDKKGKASPNSFRAWRDGMSIGKAEVLGTISESQASQESIIPAGISNLRTTA